MRVKIENQHIVVADIKNCNSMVRFFSLKADTYKNLYERSFLDFIDYLTRRGLDFDDEAAGLKVEDILAKLKEAGEKINWSKDTYIVLS